MVVHQMARLSFSTTILFAVSAAVAQTNHPAPGTAGGEFRAACGEDLRRFLCRRATWRPHASAKLTATSTRRGPLPTAAASATSLSSSAPGVAKKP